jgi:hypothetical protein
MTEQNTQGPAPAGWYPVAPGSPQLRWWDGTQWTEHHHTVGVSPMNPVYAGPDLRAPEGTKTGTVWIWIFALVPLLQLAEIPFLLTFYTKVLGAFSLSDPTAVEHAEFAPDSGIWGLWGVALVGYAICVVFALLDYRALGKRGVPRPFHWAWTFLSSLVYMIGRTVVVRRRTGTGLAPLWVNIAALVAVFVVTQIVLDPIIAAATTSLVP